MEGLDQPNGLRSSHGRVPDLCCDGTGSTLGRGLCLRGNRFRCQRVELIGISPGPSEPLLIDVAWHALIPPFRRGMLDGGEIAPAPLAARPPVGLSMEIASARLFLLALALQFQASALRLLVSLPLSSAFLLVAPLGVGREDHPGHDVVELFLEGVV